MATTQSPSNPLVGDVVALTTTRTVNSTTVTVDSPEYHLTSVPPGSTLATGRLLAGRGFPTGTVLASTSNTRKSFSVNLAESAGVYTGSTITWTSGQNAGRTSTVSAHSSGALELAADLQSLPSAGDTFSIDADETLERVTFSPDKPGAYAISCAVYRDFAAASQFEGDGSGAQRRELVTTETHTVHVGIAADLQIRTGSGAGVTLRVKAHNATVTAAELIDPLTSADYMATKDATVLTKLSALVSTAVTSLGPDLTVAVPELIAEYNDHRVLTAGSVHIVADSTYAYVPDRPYDKANSIEQLNALRTQLVGHMTGASAAGSRWHTADDTKNVPIVEPAQTLAQAQTLYADMRRCYERHRVQIASPASHGGTGDTTNALSAVDKQSDLIIAYLDFVAATQPTVPTGASSAELRLQSMLGYTIAG